MMLKIAMTAAFLKVATASESEEKREPTGSASSQKRKNHAKPLRKGDRLLKKDGSFLTHATPESFSKTQPLLMECYNLKGQAKESMIKMLDDLEDVDRKKWEKALAAQKTSADYDAFLKKEAERCIKEQVSVSDDISDEEWSGKNFNLPKQMLKYGLESRSSKEFEAYKERVHSEIQNYNIYTVYAKIKEILKRDEYLSAKELIKEVEETYPEFDPETFFAKATTLDTLIRYGKGHNLAYINKQFLELLQQKFNGGEKFTLADIQKDLQEEFPEEEINDAFIEKILFSEKIVNSQEENNAIETEFDLSNMSGLMNFDELDELRMGRRLLTRLSAAESTN